ncbi:IS1595 family transposase [Caulobacter sp. CCG-8]|uniref:IS1595 family transposase n=1 Tax=Caulobacter sp. CCG-8 TaxID=3127958 RepID=UPI00307CD8EA
MSALSAPHFHNEEAAYAYVEARIWPEGPVCPHCGGCERISKMGGASTRIGTYKCYQCRKPFTVKVGTIFEASHVAMRLWLQAMYLMAASKKGISSQQLHRTLGVTLKTAWFMSHRIRLAMENGGDWTLGGEGKIVEADETYFGKTDDMRGVKPAKPNPKKKGRTKKNIRPIIALVERGGIAKVFHVKNADKATVSALVMANVHPDTRLHTDESRLYTGADQVFATHETVRHIAKEYARGDVTTNTVEGFFSVFKRGMRGVYQHCSEKHLNRYVSEFGFRYNNRIALGVNDLARADNLLSGVVGKRLTYRTAREQV